MARHVHEAVGACALASVVTVEAGLDPSLSGAAGRGAVGRRGARACVRNARTAPHFALRGNRAQSHGPLVARAEDAEALLAEDFQRANVPLMRLARVMEGAGGEEADTPW